MKPHSDSPWSVLIPRRTFLTTLVWSTVGAIAGGTATTGCKGYPPPSFPPKALSPRDVAILAAVASTIFPGYDGLPDAAATHALKRIDDVLSTGDPGDLKQIKGLLWLVEHLPLLPFSFSRFTALSPEGRRASLEGWAFSRMGIRKAGYQALKRLIAFGYFTDPKTWPAIHYDGPSPPLREGRKPLPPGLFDSSAYAHDMSQEAQVCIVGSGAGGSPVAAALAEAGVSVVLLEEGPYVTKNDFNEKEEDMIPLLYRDRGSQATHDLSIPVLQGRCVGGSTVVNMALCFRTPEGILHEWGIAPKDMTPFFDRVERDIHVEDVAEGMVNENNSILLRGAQALGWKGNRFRRNQKGCVGAGFCMLGCPYDAKMTMNLNYVSRALAAGARVFSECRADRIVVADGSAKGVEASLLDTVSGRPRARITIRAKTVIVSAGAIHSPLLLMRSGIEDSSGMTGRNLILHPVIPVAGSFGKDIYGYRGIPQSAYTDQFLEDPGYILEGIFSHPTIFAAGAAGMGQTLASFLLEYHRTAIVEIIRRDRGRGAVRPGEGPNKARISYRLEEADRRAIRHAVKRSAEVLFHEGAAAVYPPITRPTALRRLKELDRVDSLSLLPNEAILFSAHPQGTCRMGADPTLSVVNLHGEHHRVRNLFVSDASIHPTATGVNPQVSVMALSLRLAHRLLENKAHYL